MEADDIRPQVYRDERPAEALAPFHAWARTHEPGWTYTAVRILLTPVALVLYRARQTGRDNVPADGPVILAPNHFSNMDHFFCGVFLRRRIRFMTQVAVLRQQPAAQLPVPRVRATSPCAAGSPTRRRSSPPTRSSPAAGVVGMYAEGGRSRTGGLGEPRPGIGRLALESGAPVVPVAIHGSAEVRGWRRGRFPRITVSYGEPITFTPVASPDRALQQATAEQIFDRVKALYAALDAS